MSLVNSASAKASASGPSRTHLRSGDSSHRLHAVRVATCSATASPKSAAHAQPSQSVQFAPASRWTLSNAVRCRSTVDTPHLCFGFDEFVQATAQLYRRCAVSSVSSETRRGAGTRRLSLGGPFRGRLDEQREQRARRLLLELPLDPDAERVGRWDL